MIANLVFITRVQFQIKRVPTGIAIVFSRAEETVQYPAAVKMYEFLELRKHRMGLE